MAVFSFQQISFHRFHLQPWMLWMPQKNCGKLMRGIVPKGVQKFGSCFRCSNSALENLYENPSLLDNHIEESHGFFRVSHEWMGYDGMKKGILILRLFYVANWKIAMFWFHNSSF